MIEPQPAPESRLWIGICIAAVLLVLLMGSGVIRAMMAGRL